MKEADRLLIKAVENGDAAAMRAALQKGADPSTADEGVPMLILVASGRRPDLVQLLLDAGANTNAMDTNGYTTLSCLAGLGCGSKHEQIFDALVKAGADINLAGPHGQRPLDFAAKLQNRPMIDKLVALNAKCGAAARNLLRASRRDEEPRR